jgi:hypothetical protein
VGQKYGGASEPKMTLFSLIIKSLGLIMGLLAITVGIIIYLGRPSDRKINSHLVNRDPLVANKS